jgi:hypothetical protein
VGQDLKVLSANKSVVVVRLPNGSSLKILRQWTDADGRQSDHELQGESTLSLGRLRELLELLDSCAPMRDLLSSETESSDRESNIPCHAAMSLAPTGPQPTSAANKRFNDQSGEKVELVWFYLARNR